MGDGQDDVLAHFQQCGILLDRILQPLPCPCLFAQVPLDNQVGNDEQHDGGDNQPRDDTRRAVVGVLKMSGFGFEDTLRLIVHCVYQGAQLEVKYLVMTA